MLVIDDNMFRLAKMQETLLKVSPSNRQENLSNYKKTVVEIDMKAFADILDEIKHIDEHNQTLENELQFLESIEKTYNQLEELQANFKRTCELYGDSDLELSDLAQLNIEYIRNRISAINGYLTNLENIEENKKKLQELNEQLVLEEKKKVSLDNKLLEMEATLRNNFLNAEGRYIVDGKLQYTSVVSEYEDLGFDFRELLNGRDSLEIRLSEFEVKRTEVAESVRAAELCYNSMLNAESKQVLSEINREFLFVKYKLTMLKILKLLSQNYVEYDDFVKKREQLVDLIKYRLSCIDGLGMKISIDPFSRTKLNEQLETVLSLTDNSKTINKIRKEISSLNSRTEEMLNQNSNYLISLSDTRNLIESNVGFNDIDVSPVEFDFEDMLMKKEIAANQVIGVRDVSSKFRMSIVGQKTASVIKRVNQMMSTPLVKEEPKDTLVVPELVIVPRTLDVHKQEGVFETDEDYLEEDLIQENDEQEKVNLQLLPVIEPKDALVVDTDSIFETVVPFDEPSLFVDRTDEDSPEDVMPVGDSLTEEELYTIANEEDDSLELTYTNPEEEMPDAFWITQSEEEKVSDYVIPSFDDQINMLLATENEDKSDAKTRKKVA